MGVTATWFAPRVEVDDWRVHGLWCVVGLAVALPTLLSARRSNFAIILTDHRLMFLAIFSVFMLFGGALLGLGPERQMAVALSHYPFDARDALRVAGINGMGFGLALMIATLSRGRWLGSRADLVATWVGQVPPGWAAGAFLIIGTVATLYRLPYDLGFSQGTPSGSVRLLGHVSLVAIFVATSSRGANERLLRWLGVALTTVLVLIGAATLMKASVLAPLATLAAGLAMRFGSRVVLPVAALVLVSTFVISGDLVAYGRYLVSQTRGPVNLGDRWSLLQEARLAQSDFGEDRQYAWWARLCNVPSEVAALEFRDEGNGGPGIDRMGWVFVPRALAPHKPIMTWGDELYTKITGAVGSNDAIGIFASGYYHGGWGGFVFASLICGWILAQTSAVARAVHVHQAVLMLPLSLLGVSIAAEVGGDFVSGFMGLFAFVLYPVLGVALFLHRSARRQGGGLAVRQHVSSPL